MTYEHKVLIVDNEENVRASIRALFENESVKLRCTQSATNAFKEIKRSKKKISLIIAGQHIPGIKGSDFLEYAKAMTPDTIRFLILEDFNFHRIIKSVNKGVVHRFISKKWDKENLQIVLKNALIQFERAAADQLWLKKIKQQNRELFEWNNERKELIKEQNDALSKLNKAILDIKSAIRREHGFASMDPDLIEQKMETIFARQEGVKSDQLSAFYSNVVKQIFLEFEECANRSGFEMTEI